MTPTATLDPVEQQQEQTDPDHPYGPENEKLPDQLVQVIKSTVKAFQQQEQYLRRREVIRDRRNRFYERGYQHIFWQGGSNAGFSQMTPGGMVTNSAGKNVQAPTYCDDYNIFQPYLRIIEAILTQTLPSIDFRPINPQITEDCEAAETAEGYRHEFDRTNDVKAIMLQIVRMMALSARVVLWTRTEARGEKYGTNAQGQPAKRELCTVYGSLESKVPILAHDQDECLYAFLYDDPDIRKAKSDYPDFADEIQANTSGLGENSYERLARLGVLQGGRTENATAEAFSHVVTRMHCWLRPAAFTGKEYDVDFEEGDGETVKEALTRLFPDGCCAKFVGETYVGSYAESMDDALHIIPGPYHQDGMFQLAVMDPIVVVQDSFNDAMNAAREIFDTGWPSRWVSAQDQDYDSYAEQRAEPYAIRQLKGVPAGAKAADQFYEEKSPELPATFVGHVEMLQGPLPQFMLAAPPALFGASMQDQKTASGYAQARAQAMGQQGLIFATIQQAFAVMYKQAALCAAENPDHQDEIAIPGSEETKTVRLEKLSKGNFGAYPDDDSSFPESTEAKRAVLEKMVEILGPTTLGLQLLQAPDNLMTYLRINGFPELVIPEAEAAQQQQYEIEELLLQAPLPPPPAAQDEAMVQHAAMSIAARNSGQPEPPAPDPMQLEEPSVPVNEWDFHQWHAAKCQDWLNSSACRKELAAGNQDGVNNVVLHWKKHLEMMAANQPPPIAQPPGGRPELPPPPINSQDTPPGAPGQATI